MPLNKPGHMLVHTYTSYRGLRCIYQQEGMERREGGKKYIIYFYRIKYAPKIGQFLGKIISAGRGKIFYTFRDEICRISHPKSIEYHHMPLKQDS